MHDLDRCTQWAKEPPTGGSSSPRRSRPSSRPTVRRGSGRPSRRPRRGYARPWPPPQGSGVGGPRRPPLPWRAGNAGVRGGAAPRQPPQGTHGVWPHGVSWLVSHNHADSRVICMTGSRGRPGLSSARLAGDEGEQADPSLLDDGGALLSRPFSPYPYPSETQDRQSWALLRPVRYPKSLQNDRKWPPAIGPGASRILRAPLPRLTLLGYRTSQREARAQPKSNPSDDAVAGRNPDCSSSTTPPLT